MNNKLIIVCILIITIGCNKMTTKAEPYIEYKYDDNGRVVIPSENQLKLIPKDGGTMWNRLVFEKSPYLLQHAANPVDWFPWSQEAFDLAQELKINIIDSSNLID